jgi:ATP synthase protein I
MIIGLAVGCFNAWHWLSQQDKAMKDESGGDDE